MSGVISIEDVRMNLYEIVVGAILIGLALMYIRYQQSALYALIDTVKANIVAEEKLYQQDDEINFNQVSHNELYTIIMGYREYPLIIDESYIPTNTNDFELYFSYIKRGYYEKSYGFDIYHRIETVIYSHTGT